MPLFCAPPERRVCRRGRSSAIPARKVCHLRGPREEREPADIGLPPAWGTHEGHRHVLTAFVALCHIGFLTLEMSWDRSDGVVSTKAKVTIVRHVVAVAVLPFVAAVVIPASLAWREGITLHVARGPIALLVQGAGAGLFLCGLALFLGSLRRFATEGEGTLAPWDPPRQLVVSGLYRHVRNPMISGVLFVLLGEALLLRSRAHLVWTLLFFVLNAIYIPSVEEPQLARRFGEDYREYRRHVPRLIPRLRPWTPPPTDG